MHQLQKHTFPLIKLERHQLTLKLAGSKDIVNCINQTLKRNCNCFSEGEMQIKLLTLVNALASNF